MHKQELPNDDFNAFGDLPELPAGSQACFGPRPQPRPKPKPVVVIETPPDYRPGEKLIWLKRKHYMNRAVTEVEVVFVQYREWAQVRLPCGRLRIVKPKNLRRPSGAAQ